jgi:Ion channel
MAGDGLDPNERAGRLPQYVWMLAAILVSYVVVIGVGDSSVGRPTRIVLLGFLAFTPARLLRVRWLRRLSVVLGLAALVSTGVAVAVAPGRVTAGMVGAWSTVLLAIAIAGLVSTLVRRAAVDTTTVIGVLCIYLLLALLFAGVHEVLASFSPKYLNGTAEPPTASDLLYFSVITVTTVGFGDITPASAVARAVTVVEAMTGQLYLVSVVAGVVAGWRSTRTPDPDPPSG